MEIKWRNIIGLIVLVFAALLALWVGPQLLEALRSFAPPSHRGSDDDRVYGLCVLGLLMVTLVVIVKLVVLRGR